MVTREEIITEARSWIDTKYVNGQRRKQIGVDCLGILIGVCTELNLGNYDKQEYKATQFPTNIVEELESICGPQVKVRPGCIQVMEFYRLARHIVIRTGIDTILHAYTSGEKVIEHEVPPSWLDRFVATFDFPGVCDD